jgi:hypothetical protein
VNLRLGYDVDRDFNAFANVSYRIARFDEPRIVEDRSNPLNALEGVSEGDERDFESLAFRVGSELDFDRLVTGEFSLGVDRRFSADDDDSFAFSFDADLDWTLTPRTTVSLRGSQGFEPTTGDDGGSQRTAIAVDLSYALTRQASLGADFRYLRDERDENNRTDDDFSAGVSASYDINRYTSVAANYSYRQRNSTIDRREFTRNAVFLTLVGRY